MGLIVKKIRHANVDVKDVYINLKHVILANEVEEREVGIADSNDIVMSRVKEWKRIAIFFAYVSEDAYKVGVEPISSYKVEFSLEDFWEEGIISIEKLYSELVKNNFSDNEVIHV